MLQVGTPTKRPALGNPDPYQWSAITNMKGQYYAVQQGESTGYAYDRYGIRKLRTCVCSTVL